MRYLLLFTFFSIGSNVSGQLELQNWLGISFEEAQKKAGTISDVFTHVRSDLKLPISKSRGGQLICEKFKLSPDLILDKVAFIFFNNKLTLIQSKDPKLSIAIKKKQNVKPLDYGGYLIYPEEVIAISKKDKRVSIFNKEHLHVHLFLWENPELRTEIKRIPRAVDLLKMKLGET